MLDPKTLHPLWRSYRRRRFVAVVGFGTGIFWAANPSEWRYLSPWLAVLFLAVFVVGGVGWVRLWFFRCPRCRSTFHVRPGSFVFSLFKCHHCGLPLWADPGGAKTPS